MSLFIGIVSLYSEPLHIVNKILLQIVFNIRRVDCIDPLGKIQSRLKLHTFSVRPYSKTKQISNKSHVSLTEG